jgi:hypothetical protein
MEHSHILKQFGLENGILCLKHRSLFSLKYYFEIRRFPSKMSDMYFANNRQLSNLGSKTVLDFFLR